MVRVRNMESVSGNAVENQFIIKTDQGLYFQSYESVIVFIPFDSRKVVLDEKYYDYSKTTVKYRNQFLGCDSQEVWRRIANGTYIFGDLNTEGIK